MSNNNLTGGGQDLLLLRRRMMMGKQDESFRHIYYKTSDGLPCADNDIVLNVKVGSTITRTYKDGVGVISTDIPIKGFNLRPTIDGESNITAVSTDINHLIDGLLYVDKGVDSSGVTFIFLAQNFRHIDKYWLDDGVSYMVYSYSMYGTNTGTLNPPFLWIIGNGVRCNKKLMMRSTEQNLYVVFKDEIPEYTRDMTYFGHKAILVPPSSIDAYKTAFAPSTKIYGFYESDEVPTGEGEAEYCLVNNLSLYHYENGVWVLIKA